MPGPVLGAVGKGQSPTDLPSPLCLCFFPELEGTKMEILSSWRRGAEGVGRGRLREGRPAAGAVASLGLKLAGAEMIHGTGMSESGV